MTQIFVKPVENADTDPEGPLRDKIITLNVGGRIFQTKGSTLRSTEKGRLSSLSETDPCYDEKTGEYFFDRDAHYFRMVLMFYRTGQVHVEGPHCAKTLKSELEFWGLSDAEIGDCCWQNVCETRQRDREYGELLKESSQWRKSAVKRKDMSTKEKLWEFLDNPRSSKFARAWFLLSVGLIVVSTTCCAINTLPCIKSALRVQAEGQTSEHTTGSSLAFTAYVRRTLLITNLIDAGCLAFFTTDLLLRVLAAPQRCKFLKSCLFISDIFFLLPGWTVAAITLSDSSALVYLVQKKGAAIFLQIVTLTRVFRVLRLGWYSNGFRTFVLVLKKSRRELFVLFCILAINVAIYGFLIYSAEVGTNNKFDSAFRGFWWAAITLSTVGYGDLFPQTAAGCIIGGACAVSGIVIIGLLIPIIASNFRLYYGFQHNVSSFQSQTGNRGVPEI